MKEGHQTTIGARPWRFVDQLKPKLFEPRQLPLNISHFEGDMMDSLPPFLQESRDGGIRIERFCQLYMRLSQIEHRGLDLVLGKVFIPIRSFAEQFLKKRLGGFKVPDRYADMGNPFDHEALLTQKIEN